MNKTKIKVSVTFDELGMITHWAVPVRVEPAPVKRAVDWVEVGLWILAGVMFVAISIGIATT